MRKDTVVAVAVDVDVAGWESGSVSLDVVKAVLLAPQLQGTGTDTKKECWVRDALNGRDYARAVMESSNNISVWSMGSRKS